MSLSKDYLKKHFAQNYKEFYQVDLFKKEGFTRANCVECGKGFWSAGETTSCGDSSHTPYSFFKEKPGKETYASFWKKSADFWKKAGHEVIPRYPTLCRWRDDLPFTIASIVDFQRLEQGRVAFEYPANPLFVPQMCLRFPDIANVGVTGRHFTCFMMAGQHAFNYPKDGYWKDKCLELNYGYLTKVLGINKNDITYGEDVWNMPDFSAFGPCIESFSKGSELVNSVFMQYRAEDYLKSNKFSELDLKVIDVGWGFERLLWYNNGNYSAYDAVFPREVEFMKKQAGIKLEPELFKRYAVLSAGLDVDTVLDYKAEKEKIAKALRISVGEMEKTIAPLQAIYAIADHSRTLLFALSDGALPSNAAGGYNLRVVARRAFSFMQRYNFDFSLFDLVKMHAEDLKPMFPELSENLETIKQILDSEQRKYNESVQKASKLAGDVLKQKEINVNDMITLYESHGVTPELIEQAAKQQGREVSVPTQFYSELTKKREMDKSDKDNSSTGEKKAKSELDTSELPATKLVYYSNQATTELKAKVLAVGKNNLILDQTILYPEGGGQMNDKGTIALPAGTLNIINVQKQGKVVVHFTDHAGEALLAKTKKGTAVEIHLNVERRQAIMKHHTATHMTLATCFNYFGPHVWQQGSRKDEDEAHIDISHFEKPTLEQLHEIERRVNAAIAAKLPVEVIELDRKKAEAKYGMRLYQGSGAVAKEIRIVDIHGLDTEACGGTHCTNTSELGFYKIKSAEQVQDGVIRLRYCASQAALKHLQEQEKLLDETSAVLSVPRKEAPAAARKFFEEWKDQRRDLDKLHESLAASTAELEIAKNAKTKRVELLNQPLPAKLLEKIADRIAKEPGYVVALSNTDGFIVIGCNPTSGHKASDLLKQYGALGGGSPAFARGKVQPKK